MIKAVRGMVSPDGVDIEVNHTEAVLPDIAVRVVSGVDPEIIELVLPVGAEPVVGAGAPATRLRFPLPLGRPIRAILPVVREGGQEIPVQTTSTYRLGNLLPVTPKDLSNIVFHRSSRIKEPETLSFVMDQIYRSSWNGYFERIEAVKILAYQALETVDTDAMPECLERTRKALAWVPHLPHEFGIAKTSRYQSRISLLYLRYLLRLFMGDDRGALKELRILGSSIESVAECPIAAYNLVLALLVRGQLMAMAGDGRNAKVCWSEVIRVFRTAAANMPSRTPSTFVELTISLEAAKQASFALAELRSKRVDPISGLTTQKIAANFSRLRQPAAQAFYRECLDRVGADPATAQKIQARARPEA